MLIDGLQFTQTAVADNFRIETGIELPTSPADGDTFRLTAQDGSYYPGIYYFEQLSGLWIPFDSRAIKGSAGSIATLDNAGHLPSATLPAVALTEVHVVATESAMLALDAQPGDVAIRTDEDKTYILRLTDATQLSSWVQLPGSAVGGVSSVNGRIGDVVLTAPDVGAVATSQIGASNGVAGLDTNGKIIGSQFPSDVARTVNGQSGTVVLSAADVGAVDLTAVGVANGIAALGLDGKVPSAQLPDTSNAVTSVNSKTGAVNLTYTDVGALSSASKGSANGVASLDATGKVPQSQIPSMAINATHVVASQVAMLALSANTGDIAVRTDLNKTFILKTTPASTLSNWQEMLSPTGAVSSVNGLTGAVNLTAQEVGAVSTGAVGSSSGVASLDATGKVPTTQLPIIPVELLPASASPVNSVNGMTGDVSITNISGNAATASKLLTARNINFTGDLSGSNGFDGSANINIAATLANSGVTAGSYGSATLIPILTLDSKGRVVSASTVAAQAVAGVNSVNGQSGTVTLNATNVGAVPTTAVGAANGVASLDATGKVPAAQIPNISITNNIVVSSESEMLSSGASVGTMAIRTDVSLTYILKTSPATDINNWQQLSNPTGVASVNGHTGVVSLTYTDVGALSSGSRGAANGVASLDSNAKVPSAQIDTSGLVTTAQKGVANGVASLDSGGHIPVAQIPPSASPVLSVAGKTGTVTLVASDVSGVVSTSMIGAGFGVAGLDGSGKIPSAQLPAIAITNTYVAASQVAMLALVAETGDICVRSDLSKSYVLAGSDPSVLGNWQELLTPSGSAAVTSVNGHTGSVSLVAADVGAIATTAAGASNGVASLDATAKLNVGQIPTSVITTSKVGAANGVASLDANGQVPTAQLPSTGIVTSVNGNSGAVTLTDISGNAATATALQTARTISLTGSVTGSASFDGSANISIETTGGSGGSSAYDIGSQFDGKPDAGYKVLRFTAIRAFTLPVNMTGAVLKADTGATSSAAFDLKKNGTTFCTATFAAAGTVASFGACALQTFNIGDVLTIVAPAIQDATLTDLTIGLPGTLV